MKEERKGFVIQFFSCIKDVFEKDLVRKIIQFSEADAAANFDIAPTSIHIQRFTGHVHDWSILNDWPIQKIYLLTPKWGSFCNIAKYLTHAVSTCKRVKHVVKVLCAYLRNIQSFHGGYEIYLI